MFRNYFKLTLGSFIGGDLLSYITTYFNHVKLLVFNTIKLLLAAHKLSC